MKRIKDKTAPEKTNKITTMNIKLNHKMTESCKVKDAVAETIGAGKAGTMAVEKSEMMPAGKTKTMAVERSEMMPAGKTKTMAVERSEMMPAGKTEIMAAGRSGKTGNRAMWRLVCLFACLILVMAMLPACGAASDGSNAAAESSDTGSSADASGITDSSDSSEASGNSDSSDVSGTIDQAYIDEQSVDISALAGEDGVDVDLTKLSSTMVYSVVNDMMVRPNEYLGKVIKMNGIMSVYHDEDTGNTYYACIIMDATACCSQGIEFKTTDGKYPAEGEDVTVTGTYGLYDEDGVQYCILNDAALS